MDVSCTSNLEITDISYTMSSNEKTSKGNCIMGTNRMVSISEKFRMPSIGTVTLITCLEGQDIMTNEQMFANCHVIDD